MRLQSQVVKSQAEKVKEVAEIISSDVVGSWHPMDSFNITPQSILRCIPSTLSPLLGTLARESNHPAQISIAQDIMALVTRKTPPKHVTLASSVRHITGSKIIIDLLNKSGHSCSYTELSRLYTGTSLMEIDRAKEAGVIIPQNILPASLGFIQAAADNDDFQEDTRDGRQTTHGTTMVLLQQQAEFGTVSLSGNVSKTRRTSLKPDDYQKLIYLKEINQFKKVEPKMLKETRAMRTLDRDFLSTTPAMHAASTAEQEWILARLAPTKFFDLDIQPSYQNCPSWSSHNARKFKDHGSPVIAAVGYCPMLNFNPNNPNTIYTVMCNLQKMMVALNQKHSVITFDLALYRIAKEIQWSRPEQFQTL